MIDFVLALIQDGVDIDDALVQAADYFGLDSRGQNQILWELEKMGEV